MLEITDLTAGYRPRVDVLHGVTMTIGDGDFVAILGANGAGKSSLARTISGMIRPRSGSITWNGVALPSDPEKVARMGINHVPEARGVFGNLTIHDNLLLGAYWVRDRRTLTERAEVAYEMFPILRERRDHLAGTLSGGQQQMLAIGRGLMANPKLLIVDEPSLGLAPNLVEEVMETLASLNSSGVTVVLIEQNAIALEYCQRGYVLRAGRVVVGNTAEALAGSDLLRDSYL
ncbi:ABC transporter ATP-binding protein [Microbacterium sp. A84]|uniref:ABC transporter ATP-binding protein n=1 Tax=Microbacterium sp. A84 TaxID=3450715 RepID=UPI003F4213F1